MSAAPASPPPPESETGRLRRELEAQALLVQNIRRDLVESQITVLELHDTIVQKETEKADAVSLLARLELALEEKINHIFELDRVLNQRLAALGRELEAEKAARDATIRDLVARLDAANREIGATHELAAGFARELAQAREQLQATAARLDATQRDRDATAADRDARRAEIAALRATLSWRLTAPFRRLRRMLS